MAQGTLEDFQALQQLYWKLRIEPRRNRRNQKGTTSMDKDYEVFVIRKNLKAQKVITLLEESTTKKVTFIGPVAKKGVEVQALARLPFEAAHVGVMWGNKPYDPKIVALQLLGQPKVSSAAVDLIEGILNMDTRGKSSEQIRQEIVRLVGDLPEGHPLRTVPKQFPDRSTAIAAYTAVRQAIFSTKQKSEGAATMAAKKKAVTNEAAGTADTTKAAGTTPAADPKAKPATGKSTKAAADVKAEEGKTADAKKDAATPAAGKKAAGKDAKALAGAAKAKTGRKPNTDLEGPFKLTKVAVDAKEPSGLRMHEGSARFKLMDFAMKRKSVNPITLEELVAVAGDDTRQALSVCMKLGYIVKA